MCQIASQAVRLSCFCSFICGDASKTNKQAGLVGPPLGGPGLIRLTPPNSVNNGGVIEKKFVFVFQHQFGQSTLLIHLSGIRDMYA